MVIANPSTSPLLDYLVKVTIVVLRSVLHIAEVAIAECPRINNTIKS